MTKNVQNSIYTNDECNIKCIPRAWFGLRRSRTSVLGTKSALTSGKPCSSVDPPEDSHFFGYDISESFHPENKTDIHIWLWTWYILHHHHLNIDSWRNCSKTRRLQNNFIASKIVCPASSIIICSLSLIFGYRYKILIVDWIFMIQLENWIP